MFSGAVARIAVALLVAAFAAVPGHATQARAPEAEPSEDPPTRVYAVLFARGPGYVEDAGPHGQSGMEQHVKFITELHADGVAPLAGALFDDDERQQVSGILYFVRAANVQEAREIAMQEPMVRTRVIVIASVREFMIGVGVGRLD